jgi:hypothetical protein
MTFEDRLEAAVERYAQGARTDVDAYAVARLLLTSGGSGRWARLTSPFDAPAVRLAAAIVALLLALAAAVLVGRALQREPDLPIVQGEFTRLGPFSYEDLAHAIGLADRRVLLIGSGTQSNTGTDFGFAEIFDPVTGDLTRLDQRPLMRYMMWQGVVRLADGRVLLTGGDEVNPEAGGPGPGVSEIFDPATGAISDIGLMVFPRYGHTATLLNDGRVLLAGGDASMENTRDQSAPAELFDPATGIFRATHRLTHPRMYHRATLLDDGRVLLTGGTFGLKPVTEAEIFDPVTETFEVVGSLRRGRFDHSSTLLRDGRVLIVGGIGLDDRGVFEDGIASAEVFDPDSGGFTETEPLATERGHHGAVLLQDNRVLIAGGSNSDGNPSTTELFDPATGRFVRGADTLERLGPISAALLPDGQVLVAGERHALELFDPSLTGLANPTPGPWSGDFAGTVTTIEPPAVERMAHTATRLVDGRVLITGGNRPDGTQLDSAELYDPSTGHWSATGSLNVPRSYHTAVLLADGRVLVAGSQAQRLLPDGSTETVELNSAEVYDPATGEFTPTGPMTIGRAGSSGCCPQTERFPATALSDGRVLIAGGADKPGLDLFDPRTDTFTGVRANCQGHTVGLHDGRFLLGCGPGYVFDPASGQVLPVTDNADWKRLGKRLPDGKLLFTDTVGSDPLVFDPAGYVPGEQLPWSCCAKFNDLIWDKFGIGTNAETLTQLPDGRILVFALRPDDTNHPLQLGLALVFDPELLTFTEVASPTGRHANSATMMHDGRILFVGRPIRSPDRTDPEPPVAEILDLGLPR